MNETYATTLENWINDSGNPFVRNWNTLTAKRRYWHGSPWRAFELAFGVRR